MSRKSADKPLATPDLLSTIFYLPKYARVVEWQTRTFEGRMPKGMRVQVPPRAPKVSRSYLLIENRCEFFVKT
jgi:hypothetical protein